MRNPMSRFSLKYQVGLTGAISLVGLLSLGGFVLVSSGAETEAFERAEAATAASGTISQVQIDLLQARRAEKDLLARRDLAYVQKNADALASARDALAALDGQLEDAGASVATRAEVPAILEGLDGYAAAFSTVAQGLQTIGLDPESGLTGAMRASVHAVEEQVKAAELDELTITMLMMRRHEKDFQARLDPKYADQMDERAAEFGAALDDASLPAAARSGIEADMAAYQADFDALVAATLQQVTDVGALSDSYKVVEPLLEALDEDVAKVFEAESASFRADRDRNNSVLIWAVVMLCLFIAAVTAVVARGLYRPLRAITATMERLAGGDRGVEIVGTDRRDEIGDMASAVQVFKDNANEIERIRLEQIERDERDRRQQAVRQAEEERIRTEQAEIAQRERQAAERAAMSQIADGFERSVGEILEYLAAAATEMQATATAMAGNAENTSVQSEEVSTASALASSNVQAVAVAADQLAAGVRDISRQVAESARITGDAVLEIERTNATVRGLAESAERIGAVINLVNEIAGQTNLLALNATIEAARAGEAGKGFGVVASEVKELAKQTAAATEEIGAQIAAIQQSTSEAVAVITGIGGTINGVNEIATTIASAVEEQGVAVQEIARNVDQASNGTRRVSDNIASVSQAAGATRTAAHDVLSASGELSVRSEQLRHQVQEFLGRVATVG